MTNRVIQTIQIEDPAAFAQVVQVPYGGKPLDAFAVPTGNVVLTVESDQGASQEEVVVYLLRDGDVVSPGLAFLRTVFHPGQQRVQHVFIARKNQHTLHDVERGR